MSALNNDRNTVRKEGVYAAYPVKGGAVIYAGGIVCLGADGYALPGSDTAGLKTAGIARGYVDNSSGSDGDGYVEVWRKGCFNLSSAGMSAANAGDAVYVLDDQTVGLSASSVNQVACGIISEVVSASGVFVDIDRM
jgi:hypothetical protein